MAWLELMKELSPSCKIDADRHRTVMPNTKRLNEFITTLHYHCIVYSTTKVDDVFIDIMPNRLLMTILFFYALRIQSMTHLATQVSSLGKTNRDYPVPESLGSSLALETGIQNPEVINIDDDSHITVPVKKVKPKVPRSSVKKTPKKIKTSSKRKRKRHTDDNDDD
jgi:hypothetical protein